ncbi:Protein SAAL1 [Choanephora cucurbitarum]|uniref:Protein SAAL1 n=1 Tax=Choanephora cucurbitarum TaxID=101091 RepID=A0A1C7N8H7_9FUNG|nr:Protein SAAL1 [Choanephora cucurbitarum]
MLVVSPIMRRIIDEVINNTIDKSTTDDDDSPFERSLCAAWDVCTVQDYALAVHATQFHRVLLKIITTTQRPRTRELAMGTLANLAVHWNAGIGPGLLEDMDILLLCRSILWNENDARVLLETTRLLNTFLSCSIDHQTVVEHDHLTQLLTPVPMAPSVFHQYTIIICNTLYSELLLKSLEVMTRIVVYTNAVTNSITRRRQRVQPESMMDTADTLALVKWGAARLEEEGRGVGIGMGFHRGIAKNVMHLLWALMAYGMVSVHDCGPEMTHGLGQSMSRIVSYIQEDDLDTIEDEDIQNLAQALNTKLSMAT